MTEYYVPFFLLRYLFGLCWKICISYACNSFFTFEMNDKFDFIFSTQNHILFIAPPADSCVTTIVTQSNITEASTLTNDNNLSPFISIFIFPPRNKWSNTYFCGIPTSFSQYFTTFPWKSMERNYNYLRFPLMGIRSLKLWRLFVINLKFKTENSVRIPLQFTTVTNTCSLSHSSHLLLLCTVLETFAIKRFNCDVVLYDAKGTWICWTWIPENFVV